MADLNLDVNYFDNIKTMRLIGLLGNGAAELPIRIWCHCAKVHPKDGILARYSVQEIERIANWWGAPGAMIDAMVNLGFLERTRWGYKVHDWEEHEGHLITFHERAKTAAARRWGKDASSNATSIPKQCPNQPAVHNQPNQPTIPKDGFEVLWAKYPRREGKKQAEKHFGASVKTHQDYLDIQNALANYVAQLEANRTELKYTKQGSTWFNNWRDYVNYKVNGSAVVRPPVVPPKPKPPEPEMSESERQEAIKHFSQVKQKLRGAGKPIPKATDADLAAEARMVS